MPPANIDQQPHHNTSSHPDPTAAPHRNSVVDDDTWLEAAAGKVGVDEAVAAGGVDCSQQPPNTTPCPAPGSAPHKEELVYNDDIWYQVPTAEGLASV